MLRYNRGSIWWTELSTVTNNDEHTNVQCGKRPCVVVSNDINNLHCRTVNVCPITSSMDNLPMHPTIYVKQQGQVLTEQILTVSRDALFSYCGQATQKEMEDIETALRLQLGLQGNDLDNDIIQQLRFIELALTSIEEYKVQKTFNQTQKDVEIKQLMTRIESKVDKYRGLSQLEKFEARYPQYKKEEKSVQEPEIKEGAKRTYRKWTVEEKRTYLEDYEKLTKAQMREKYNLNSDSTVYTCGRRFAKELQNE